MPAVDLAIIIVSWNTRQLTLNAIQSLLDDLEAHGPDAEVWVFDSASTDGSPEAIQGMFPKVRLIASDQNLGFAAGNNAVLRRLGFGDAACAEDLPCAVYLLNPDTITHRGATSTLFDALFDLPDAGVVGARLTYANGDFQHSAFMFPGLMQLAIDLFPIPARLHDTRLNGRYPRQRYASNEPFPVDHTLGATMMLRQEVIRQTGMFDEGYFMYVEEVDWSKRIRQAGWEIYCVPQAHVTHLAGQSTRQTSAQSVVNLWRSRLRFYEKYYPLPKRLAARALLKLGMRFQIAQARRDKASGTLAGEECEALIDAYRTVQRM